MIILKRIRAGSVTAGVLLVAVACALSGCSRPNAFSGVNQAVADVNPSALGDVVVDTRSGSGRPLSQPPTRRVVVVASQSGHEATTDASTLLQSAGFVQTGETGWQRSKDGQFVQVFVTIQGAGSRIDGWNGAVGAGQTALVLTFTRNT
jgi:hypothetical protein